MNEADMWQSDSEWIKKEMGANITKRRIRKVSFKHNGKVLTAEVGNPNPYNGTHSGRSMRTLCEEYSFFVAVR